MYIYVPDFNRRIISTGRIDYSKIINEECGIEREVDVKTVDLSIASPNAVPTFLKSNESVLQVAVGMLQQSFKI